MDFTQILSSTVTWWDIAFALIAVVAGWVASRFAKKGVAAFMARVPNASASLASAAARIAQYSVVLLGIGVALAFLGANVQPLIAIVLIVGVVAVLVLRGVADNFAAGVLLQTRRPVVVGEEIMVTGPDDEPLVGTVVELNSRTVVVRTYDGRTAHVPNSALLGDTLVNHSRAGARRSEVEVRAALSAAASVDDIAADAVAATTAVDGVRGEPAPRAVLTTVSSERVVLRVQYWHDPADGVLVTSAVVSAVATALRGHEGAMSVTSAPGAPALTPPDPV